MYKIVYSENAVKNLKKISKKWQNKLIKAISFLKDDPCHGKKLKGKLIGYYSLRVWPYRIIYIINKKKIIVFIVSVGHRQNIYK